MLPFEIAVIVLAVLIFFPASKFIWVLIEAALIVMAESVFEHLCDAGGSA